MSNIVSNLSDNQRFIFTRVIQDDFLDVSSLITCRAVCKEFKTLVDDCFTNSIIRTQELDVAKTRSMLKKMTREYETYPTKESVIDKLQGYISRKSIFVRTFQYYVAPFVKSIYRDIMSCSLPKVQQALKADDSEESLINSLIQKIQSKYFYLQSSQLLLELGLSKDADIQTLCTQLNAIRELTEQVGRLTGKLNALNHICNLFGGEKDFMRLPFLEIGDKDIEKWGSICLEALTAPVMVGIDNMRRFFVVIRAERKDDPSQKAVQVFYQKYINDGYWANFDVKGSIIVGNLFIIYDGKPCTPIFQRLADFLKNGGNDEYRLA